MSSFQNVFRVTIFLVSCGLVLSVNVPKPTYKLDEARYIFDDFVHTYNKQYENESERNKRFKIFTKNLVIINELNLNDTSAVFGINKFADLSSEEFSRMYTGYNPSKDPQAYCNSGTPTSVKQAPAAFDWRSQNVVTPVKNQRSCGSCYAFSTIGNIESQVAIHKQQILDLSEQQLIDCSRVSNGCGGGIMAQSMSEIIDLGGVEEESDYAYRERKEACHFKKSSVKVKLAGCTQYNIQDESTLKETLYTNGPICIGIAAGAVLQRYAGGILQKCPGKIGHAVLLVGYGSEAGQDFWIIKNSWGQGWGEQGYLRIARGLNMCFLLNNLMSTAIVA